MACISAVENAVRRIRAGQGELFLVGGACNAERADLMLPFELGRMLWSAPHQPVWERREARGGMVLGSAGAFLVIESKAHAIARGARPYAALGGVVSDRSTRAPGAGAEAMRRLFDNLGGIAEDTPLAVMSGASGVEPVLAEELAFLDTVEKTGRAPATRAYGSLFGHTVEAHFPLGVALAALALKAGRFPAPLDSTGMEREHTGPLAQVLVTGMGSWRGEGLALVKAAA
jgi:3-oxoacyl-[acyl-carrier-protein] synthase II